MHQARWISRPIKTRNRSEVLVHQLLCYFHCHRFRPAPRMGSHQEVLSKTFLALTLKVEGGMWLTASTRKATP
jgi:hypothetical protein